MTPMKAGWKPYVLSQLNQLSLLLTVCFFFSFSPSFSLLLYCCSLKEEDVKATPDNASEDQQQETPAEVHPQKYTQGWVHELLLLLCMNCSCAYKTCELCIIGCVWTDCIYPMSFLSFRLLWRRTLPLIFRLFKQLWIFVDVCVCCCTLQVWDCVVSSPYHDDPWQIIVPQFYVSISLHWRHHHFLSFILLTLVGMRKKERWFLPQLLRE